MLSAMSTDLPESFRAYVVHGREDGRFAGAVETIPFASLPPHGLVVRVAYSSLNYKDALSATGHKGITRKYPHVPGIDAAGTVVATDDPRFPVGSEVLAIGFDLGMNTFGGYGEYVRIPSGWAVARPEGLSLADAMRLGTAGFTAAQCVDALLAAGLEPGHGEVVVTGASGGVGAVAVALLAKLGFDVVGASRKPEATEFLLGLGAKGVLDPAELAAVRGRPMGKERWAGAVDTVGGEPLFDLVKVMRYGAPLAACGMAGGTEFAGNVYPFILRGVRLLGIDSVLLPIEGKARIWSRLASEWKLDGLDRIAKEIGLEELPAAVAAVKEGRMVGRRLVRVAR